MDAQTHVRAVLSLRDIARANIYRYAQLGREAGSALNLSLKGNAARPSGNDAILILVYGGYITSFIISARQRSPVSSGVSDPLSRNSLWSWHRRRVAAPGRGG
jgi:hypothetical protein